MLGALFPGLFNMLVLDDAIVRSGAKQGWSRRVGKLDGKLLEGKCNMSTLVT